MAACFAPFLSVQGKQAVILDGGFGTELERIGKDYTNDPLWSARILADDPAAVKKVHRAYYDAGADVGITCSYQATHAGFKKAGFSETESDELFKRSIQLATAARDEFWEAHQQQIQSRSGKLDAWKERRLKPLVAFSSGPYAACLADGSEYTGEYADTISFEQLVDFHRRKLQVVKGQDHDVIAFETIASLKEAQAIVHLLRTEPPGKPAWLSFTCQDEKTVNHGENFAKDVVPLAFEADAVVAIGVNCTPPRFVPQLLRAASGAIKGRDKRPLLITYPNSGEGWINKTGKWDGNPDLDGQDLGAVGRDWVDCGAKIVGGCCRTTPDYISSLAAALS